MFDAKHIKIGKIGEDLACEYLKKKGYKILIRNYRKKFGEIDIIGRSKDLTLIFFEVKTLFIAKHEKQENFTPENNFTTQKRIKVNRTCQFFVGRYPSWIDEEAGWKIDLIAIELYEGGDFSIKHYENV